MKHILVLHGPNLNLLGKREPEIYGHLGLDELNKQLAATAQQQGFHLDARQSNSESQLVDWIQQADEDSALIFNPAAFTHSSISLRDALLAKKLAFIEVHISNIFNREAFRAHSFFSDIALGVISGLGTEAYFLALQYFIKRSS